MSASALQNIRTPTRKRLYRESLRKGCICFVASHLSTFPTPQESTRSRKSSKQQRRRGIYSSRYVGTNFQCHEPKLTNISIPSRGNEKPVHTLLVYRSHEEIFGRITYFVMLPFLEFPWTPFDKSVLAIFPHKNLLVSRLFISQNNRNLKEVPIFCPTRGKRKWMATNAAWRIQQLHKLHSCENNYEIFAKKDWGEDQANYRLTREYLQPCPLILIFLSIYMIHAAWWGQWPPEYAEGDTNHSKQQAKNEVSNIKSICTQVLLGENVHEDTAWKRGRH
ncbi:hypothetical protein HYFRA_00003938 [Hymenoscyphus fraxineus]|uniref:Uncharacterized protein n=1 Tax=Hymenoscyphus fraxineus TaxID=746836 RepID=A0A9N9KZ62_9HELO|nr:hypothetical protein HYFRA_00003938 [Hymenoscyphus fraxineus]